MKKVATHSEDNWTLTHCWFMDDFGLQRNAIEVSQIREDGMRVVYPLIAPPRITNVAKETPILGDDISPYETFEYAEILREWVDKINTSNDT